MDVAGCLLWKDGNVGSFDSDEIEGVTAFKGYINVSIGANVEIMDEKSVGFLLVRVPVSFMWDTCCSYW